MKTMPKMSHIIARFQPEQPVLSVRQMTHMDDFLSLYEENLQKVNSYLEQFDEYLTDVPFTIYYDYLYTDSHRMDIEFCYPLTRLLPSHAELTARIIPGSPVIFSMYRGYYEGIASLYGEMTNWIISHNFEPAGYSYEYYINGFDFPERDQLIKVVMPYKN